MWGLNNLFDIGNTIRYGLPEPWGYLLSGLIGAVFITAFGAIGPLSCNWIERKLISRFQIRYAPTAPVPMGCFSRLPTRSKF
ncbi:MAG: hypothetical protein NTZ05_12515 [Chloroflexi bacterium]|nr:hypothetical protein [Chloroflexota bacterium]